MVLWPLFVLIVGFAVITRAVFGTPSWTVIAIAVAVPATVLVPATIVFLCHWQAQHRTGVSAPPGQGHAERG